MSFTKELQNHLTQSGWFPGRVIGDYDSFMEQYAYPTFIRDFLNEYGKLKLKTLNPNTDSPLKNDVRLIIDPLESDGMNMGSVSQDWSKDLGRKLYVIGLYLPENYDIAVDENGAIYFLGEYCRCLSKDIYQGIESINRMDFWSQLGTDQPDTTTGKWFDIKGKQVDFDTYVFNYKLF